jgi:glycosyltransferase involved in cell wall biosynthesis
MSLVELSIVIPVLNEREALPELFEEVRTTCSSLGRSWEAVLVDDGSTDGSWEVIEDLARAHPEVRAVKLRRNFGKSAALAVGFAQTRGNRVVTLDGDGQDDPAEIPALLDELDRDYDLVSGWKRERRDPAVRRWASRVFNFVTSRLSGIRMHDMNCGLKAYRGDCARSLELYGELHRFTPVLAAQQGWRVSEIAVHHRPRRHGRSRFGPERYARGLFDLITVIFIGRYQNRPLHLFGGVGLVLMLIGVGICVYLTIIKIGGAAIGERPLLFLGVLLVVVGIQLGTLGLLGQMLALTRREVSGGGADEPLIERAVGEGVSRERAEAGSGRSATGTPSPR